MAMFRRIFHSLNRKSKPLLAMLSLGLLSAVCLVDYLAGPEVCVAALYFIPIAAATWFINLRAGIYVTALAALAWYLADISMGRVYAEPMFRFWNFIARFGVFMLFASLVIFVRKTLTGELSLARRDFLTGLPNSRSFYELAAAELDRAFGLSPFTLAFIDAAGLEWINNRFGYAMGDQALCSIAQVIKENVPRRDLVGRLGGTAFGVLLPDTSSEIASLIMRQIHDELKQERAKYGQPVTVYVSVVTYPKAPRSVAELIQESERRLKRLKDTNRDAVEIAIVDSIAALV